MVETATFMGAATVEFNLERSGNFQHFVPGPAEQTLPLELGVSG